MTTNGSDTNANALMASLMTDAAFVMPDLDFTGDEYKIPSGADSELYQSVKRLGNLDLTTGDGTFDTLMKAVSVHLEKEFKANRISGAEYTKTYIAAIEQAMGGAIQFLLGRDQAYWAAVNAQAQAITARVQLETAKLQYTAVLIEAMTGRANYALTKLKLATEDMQFATLKYQYENILPQQKLLLAEQTESARAQTLNTRTDGSTIVGVLGKQKDLYSQQITSYQRDAEVKAARIFTDAWTVQKTIDEGLLPPNGFTNASIEPILQALKTNNNLA